MKKQLIKLRFKINKLNLRKRIMLLVVMIIVVLFLWALLVYIPLSQRANQALETIQNEKKATVEFENKGKSIVLLAADNTTQKLLEKFERLKTDMQQLDKRIARYEQRFIGEQELAKLLYSMMNEMGSIRIENFSNVAYKRGQAPQFVPQETPDSKPAVLAGNLSSERTQYTLTLKGNYTSIMNYLKRMEQLEWQLYWDTMNYQVDTYPEATVIIEFYTLRPKSYIDMLK